MSPMNASDYSYRTVSYDGYLIQLRPSPLEIFVPAHKAMLALIPPQLDAPAQVFRDATGPSCLVDSAVYGLYLAPTLSGNDIWEVGS